MNEQIRAVNKTYKVGFGFYGPVQEITGTSAVECKGIVVCMSDDCDIASITLNGTAKTSLNGITLGQGQIIYGLATSITPNAGVFWVYAADNNDMPS